jgi:hypothetical protein
VDSREVAMTLIAAPILGNEPKAYILDSERRHTTAPRLEETAGYVQRICTEIIIPILESEEPAAILLEKWIAFKELRDGAVKARLGNSDPCLEDLLRGEDDLEAQLRGILADASEKFGEGWIRPILGGLQLRKIVREIVLPHIESWPEDSREIIADRMALNELCMGCVLYHLGTDVGRETNAQTLAVWSYHYADYAYAEAGISGKDYVPEGRLDRE